MIPKKRTLRGSFLIQVQNSQHETWQGTLNWIDKKQVTPFRSTLELIKLIDSALDSGAKEQDDNDGEPDDIT
jgi:hypothetical protein